MVRPDRPLRKSVVGKPQARRSLDSPGSAADVRPHFPTRTSCRTAARVRRL